jgi:hypothetical protein
MLYVIYMSCKSHIGVNHLHIQSFTIALILLMCMDFILHLHLQNAM